jgi:hypothetical protein
MWVLQFKAIITFCTLQIVCINDYYMGLSNIVGLKYYASIAYVSIFNGGRFNNSM